MQGRLHGGSIFPPEVWFALELGYKAAGCMQKGDVVGYGISVVEQSLHGDAPTPESHRSWAASVVEAGRNHNLVPYRAKKCEVIRSRQRG